LIHRRGRENLEYAVRDLERALRLNEGFAHAHAQLAIAYTLLVDHPNAYGTLSLEEVKRHAIPHLDRARELEPNLAEGYGGRALLAHFSGDLESTIEYARKALASNPSDIDAMNWLYAGLTALGRYQEAEATLRQMLVTDPLTIIGRMNYIGWLSSIGQIQEAHDMADQLLVQSPEFGYLAHADTSLIYEGRIAEGLSWALRAPAGNFYLIYAFNWVGEYDEARRIDENQTFWTDLAEGRFDEAIRATQRDLHLDPDNEGVIANAADILYFAGRIDEALPLYERAIDFASEDRPISAPVSDFRMLWLALARRKAGDEDGAQAAAQIVRRDYAARRAAGSKNQEQLNAEAMIAAFEHNPDRVITTMKSAIQLGLRNPQAFDDPIFEFMGNESRFVTLQQELDVILAAEHDNVLQLICFNNPAPGNWQPLPETCKSVDSLLKR
jgi:tetratricopeptide (TPR) repeat protein